MCKIAIKLRNHSSEQWIALFAAVSKRHQRELVECGGPRVATTRGQRWSYSRRVLAPPREAQPVCAPGGHNARTDATELEHFCSVRTRWQVCCMCVRWDVGRVSSGREVGDGRRCEERWFEQYARKVTHLGIYYRYLKHSSGGHFDYNESICRAVW